MNNLWLVIKREYISRVNNKTFLLTTFLTPIVSVIIMISIGYLSYLSAVNNKDVRNIVINDPINILGNNIPKQYGLNFVFDQNADTTNFKSKGYSDLILVYKNKDNDFSFNVFSAKKMNFDVESNLHKVLQFQLKEKLYLDFGINKKILDTVNNIANSVQYNVYEMGETEIKESSSGLAYMIGIIAGLFIYLTLFIYGTMVMRGVTEEKMNRISEVIISCVKPIDLMMGKVFGIGLVGLTQLILWIVLIISLSSVAMMFLPNAIQSDLMTLKQSGAINATTADVSDVAKKIFKVQSFLDSINWLFIFVIFIFYYLGGYFFYAGLFAAVGSASGDDPQDAQSLLLPVTFPIIIGFVITMQAARSPETSIALWGSIIPFTSPIVMMGRIGYGVPEVVNYWELALSMVLLVGGIFFNIWLSAKIYRSGILMYGKKFSFKEIGKIIFRKS